MAARVVAARIPARSVAARFVQTRLLSSGGGGKVPGEEEKAANMKRLTKLQERLDRLEAEEEKIQTWLPHYTSMAMLDNRWEKLDRQTKVFCYGVHAFSAFLVLRQLF